MKNLNLFCSRIAASLSVVSVFALASYNAVAADADVAAIRAKHEAMVQKMKGVRMTSLSMCDQEGNRAKTRRDGNEVCVMLGFDYEQNMRNVQSIFNTPLRIEGALYGFEVIGPNPARPE